jgi:hypothetical protein
VDASRRRPARRRLYLESRRMKRSLNQLS